MLQTMLLEHPGIQIGSFTITYYALCIVFGMIVAFLLISLLFKRRNISPDLFMTLFLICLPICLVTTRLFYCITAPLPPEEWFAWDSIRSGGLSIVGGILGGLISVFAFCMIRKVNFFRIGDCVVIGLLVAQAIGRWGNFFNQEVYGAEVTNPALQWFPFAVYIDGLEEWHYAFFFYESLFNLWGAGLRFWNARKHPYKPTGLNTAAYFTCYGLIRSIMEPLRDPTYILNGNGVPWSFVMSMVMLIGGAIWLAVLLIVNKRKHGKLIGSVNGDPYGITEFIKDNKDELAVYNNVNMMCSIYPDNYLSEAEADARREVEGMKEESLWTKIKGWFKKDKDGKGKDDVKIDDGQADDAQNSGAETDNSQTDNSQGDGE